MKTTLETITDGLTTQQQAGAFNYLIGALSFKVRCHETIHSQLVQVSVCDAVAYAKKAYPSPVAPKETEA